MWPFLLSEAGRLSVVAHARRLMLGITKHWWAGYHQKWLYKKKQHHVKYTKDRQWHPNSLCLSGLIKVFSTLQSATSWRRELLICPVLVRFLIFSYKYLEYYFTQSQISLMSLGRLHSRAVLCLIKWLSYSLHIQCCVLFTPYSQPLPREILWDMSLSVTFLYWVVSQTAHINVLNYLSLGFI